LLEKRLKPAAQKKEKREKFVPIEFSQSAHIYPTTINNNTQKSIQLHLNSNRQPNLPPNFILFKMCFEIFIQN